MRTFRPTGSRKAVSLFRSGILVAHSTLILAIALAFGEGSAWRFLTVTGVVFASLTIAMFEVRRGRGVVTITSDSIEIPDGLLRRVRVPVARDLLVRTTGGGAARTIVDSDGRKIACIHPHEFEESGEIERWLRVHFRDGDSSDGVESSDADLASVRSVEWLRVGALVIPPWAVVAVCWSAAHKTAGPIMLMLCVYCWVVVAAAGLNAVRLRPLVVLRSQSGKHPAILECLVIPTVVVCAVGLVTASRIVSVSRLLVVAAIWSAIFLTLFMRIPSESRSHEQGDGITRVVLAICLGVGTTLAANLVFDFRPRQVVQATVVSAGPRGMYSIRLLGIQGEYTIGSARPLSVGQRVAVNVAEGAFSIRRVMGLSERR